MHQLVEYWDQNVVGAEIDSTPVIEVADQMKTQAELRAKDNDHIDSEGATGNGFLESVGETVDPRFREQGFGEELF